MWLLATMSIEHCCWMCRKMTIRRDSNSYQADSESAFAGRRSRHEFNSCFGAG